MKKQKNETPRKKENDRMFSRAVSSAIPRMTLECVEKYELLLCGCKKIEAYSPEETLICTSSCRVCVKGARLSISFTGDGKIMLRGIISSIELI
jgi:hypothetical protein